MRLVYQLAGAGERPTEAEVDLARQPAPRAFLEARLGPLVAFSVVAGTDAPAAAPEPVEVPVEATDPVADQAASEPAAEPLPAAEDQPEEALARRLILAPARLRPFTAPRALLGLQAAIAQRALGLPPARAGP